MKALEGLSTLNGLLSGGGAVLLGALCFWPFCPFANCPSALHEAALPSWCLTEQRAWTHAHTHTHARTHARMSLGGGLPFVCLHVAQFHVLFNKVHNSPYNIYSEHTVFLNNQKISWLLVKYCNRSDLSNLFRVSVIGLKLVQRHHALLID